MPECGIDGDAEVLAIGPCPPVAPGRGSVVTGTFRHDNAAVIDLQVAGLDGTIRMIGTTPNHRFWSESRQRFIRADELELREKLRGEHGTINVIGKACRPLVASVYNIESYPNNVYMVSSLCIVVHNADPVTTVYRVVDAAEALSVRMTGRWSDSPLLRGHELGTKWVWKTELAAQLWLAQISKYEGKLSILEIKLKEPLSKAAVQKAQHPLLTGR